MNDQIYYWYDIKGVLPYGTMSIIIKVVLILISMGKIRVKEACFNSESALEDPPNSQGRNSKPVPPKPINFTIF